MFKKWIAALCIMAILVSSTALHISHAGSNVAPRVLPLDRVTDGTWAYFYFQGGTYEDGRQGSSSGIFAARLDGSGDWKEIWLRPEGEPMADELFIHENHLYFYQSEQEDPLYGGILVEKRLNRIALDGSKPIERFTLPSDSGTGPRRTYEHFQVYKNKLYYISRLDDTILMEAEHNGSSPRAITQLSIPHYVFKGDFLYYKGGADVWGNLVRRNLTTQKVESILSKNILHFQVEGDWVYATVNAESRLIRFPAKANVKDSEVEVVWQFVRTDWSHVSPYFFWVQGNRVYYTETFDTRTYSLRPAIHAIERQGNGQWKELGLISLDPMTIDWSTHYYDSSRVYIESSKYYQSPFPVKPIGAFNALAPARTNAYLESLKAMNTVKVRVNWEQVLGDVPPVSLFNRTMIPIGALATHLGLSIHWDQATQTAFILTEGESMDQYQALLQQLTPPQEDFHGYKQVNLIVNGKRLESDVPAIVLQNRTLVPIGPIALALGLQVEWSSSENTVNIWY